MWHTLLGQGEGRGQPTFWRQHTRFSALLLGAPLSNYVAYFDGHVSVRYLGRAENWKPMGCCFYNNMSSPRNSQFICGLFTHQHWLCSQPPLDFRFLLGQARLSYRAIVLGAFSSFCLISITMEGQMLPETKPDVAPNDGTRSGPMSASSITIISISHSSLFFQFFEVPFYKQAYENENIARRAVKIMKGCEWFWEARAVRGMGRSSLVWMFRPAPWMLSIFPAAT